MKKKRKKSSKIGNYRILEELGKGGMAKVYTALQPSLDRIVVIKEMIRSAKDSRLRFKNEARLLASLDHENIIHIYDYVTRGRNHYLVMEHVEGMSLEEILKHGPVSSKTAALIARGVLTGLQHAHAHKIVHRDIKPANILISEQGVVKLTDFGIAKGDASPNLTTTGIIVGTPYYIAPEVTFGEKASIRSDIYSVGTVLYEMVTGRKPFSGRTTRVLLEKIGKGKYPSPYWQAKDRSLRIARIIDKAMHRRENKRYQSVEKVIADIDRALGHRRVLYAQQEISDLITEIKKCSGKTTMKIDKGEKERKTFWWLVLIPILAVAIWLGLKYLIGVIP